VQWYTPSFAGGRPVFSNPEDFQFSLPQFLMWVVNPWIAVLTSLLIYIIIGFIATYYFLKILLGLGSLASILGAVFFVANASIRACGCWTFNFSSLSLACSDRDYLYPSTNYPNWLGGILLSLVVTILVYSGLHNLPSFLWYVSSFFLSCIDKAIVVELEEDTFEPLPRRNFGHLGCGSKVYPFILFIVFSPDWLGLLFDQTLDRRSWHDPSALGTMTRAPFYR